jgi:hypothetical protein
MIEAQGEFNVQTGDRLITRLDEAAVHCGVPVNAYFILLTRFAHD